MEKEKLRKEAIKIGKNEGLKEGKKSGKQMGLERRIKKGKKEIPAGTGAAGR